MVLVYNVAVADMILLMNEKQKSSNTNTIKQLSKGM